MQDLEKTFEKIRRDNSLLSFSSKKTKSLFALLYCLYLVYKGEKVLYISSYDVIDDLMFIKDKFDISKKWIESIKENNLKSEIIITSDFDAIKRLKKENSELIYSKIIFDNIHYKSVNYLKEIEFALKDENITINVIDYQRKNRLISNNLLQLFSKKFFIVLKEKKLLGFKLHQYFEVVTDSFVSKKSKIFKVKNKLK